MLKIIQINQHKDFVWGQVFKINLGFIVFSIVMYFRNKLLISSREFIKREEKLGYKRVNKEDIYQIFKRWHAGQTISFIAKTEARDRKTVRQYIKELEKAGFKKGGLFPEKDILYREIEKLLIINKRNRNISEELDRYESEIREMIHDKEDPVKPKTAFEIIKEKYRIKASYETFKLFAKKKKLKENKKDRGMIRIELPPGLENQLDYGKMGLFYDLKLKKKKVVWVFCGILSHSRLPFIQYVYTQRQKSFTESMIDMFEFYGGVTSFISMDNLKTGIVKPDLWDPKINKSLADMAEYYNVFINPCRVAKATDKGKIERMVPVARELFRKLKRLHPHADIHKLNELALFWCWETYGRREHGTTGIPPMAAFEESEKKALKPLPDSRFEVPVWKKPTVHPDQFFSFDNKRFSLPPKYRGEKVDAMLAGNLLKIFHNHILIREYVIVPFKRLYFIKEDFPEVVREMMDGSYPYYLLEKSKKYGISARQLIENVLKPEAYLNTRRAQGMLSIMENYYHKSYFDEICLRAVKRNVVLPKTFKAMLSYEETKHQEQETLFVSALSVSMVRDINYYIDE